MLLSCTGSVKRRIQGCAELISTLVLNTKIHSSLAYSQKNKSELSMVPLFFLLDVQGPGGHVCAFMFHATDLEITSTISFCHGC